MFGFFMAAILGAGLVLAGGYFGIKSYQKGMKRPVSGRFIWNEDEKKIEDILKK